MVAGWNVNAGFNDAIWHVKVRNTGNLHNTLQFLRGLCELLIVRVPLRVFRTFLYAE